MAWPFTVPASAPTSFVGPGAAMPTVPTAITTATVAVIGMNFINVSASTRIVTVTNTAGDVVHKATLPPGGSDPKGPAFEPSVGLKWSIDGGSNGDVVGHIWGY